MKMKKKKLNKLLKLGILFFGISITLWNCEKEETEFQNQQIKTVNDSEINEVKNLYFSNFARKTENSSNHVDFENISFENITNSNELLTVIPANLNYVNVNSRLLLLKVNLQNLKESVTKDINKAYSF